MVIDRLKLLQGKQTNQKFADKLGIHKVSWQRIKNRRVPLSDKFLIRVLRVFPELQTIINLYISTKDYEHAGNLSTRHQKPQNKILRAFHKLYDVILEAIKLDAQIK